MSQEPAEAVPHNYPDGRVMRFVRDWPVHSSRAAYPTTFYPW